MDTKKISKILIGTSYAYILLPFLIFTAGWMKLCFSIPIVVILIFCYYKIVCETPSLWLPELNKENVIKALFIVGLIAIWVYYSGIGKFVFQNTDHYARNGIFDLLVEKKWPIVSNNLSQFRMQGISMTGLIYYIGYWLPSAVVGKILGLRVGYYAQAIWAVLGITLLYYFVCAHLKKLRIWPLIVLIFFSGWDIVGTFLNDSNIFLIANSLHLEQWATAYQYSSITTQLFWVFNQAVPIWLCTMMIYTQKDNRNRIFILACTMLTSTLPFIGLLFIVLFFCLTQREKDFSHNIGKRSSFVQYVKAVISDTCTVQNIVGGGIIGILTFLYLSSNIAGTNSSSANTVLYNPSMQNRLFKLIVFLLLEVGVYVVVLYKYHSDNRLFYYIIVCLCIIPIIHIGTSNDFCMRTSIPFLFLIAVFTIESIEKALILKEKRMFLIIIAVLIIGGITPLHEFARTISQSNERVANNQQVEENDASTWEIMNSINFAGDVEHSIFFKYISK